MSPSAAQFQERGPVLDALIPVDAEDEHLRIQRTNDSSDSAMPGMDGEDLGVELAKVAFDVKVSRRSSICFGR